MRYTQILEKEIPEEYQDEYLDIFIHDVLEEELGYDTSDLNVVECFDKTVDYGIRCYWKNLLIIIHENKLYILKKVE